MTASHLTLAAWAAAAFFSCAAQAADAGSAKLPPELIRGKYLVQIAGCNDCHTAGYAESGGKVEESKWLLGDRLGWRGPWGTTYASNLRLAVKDMTAEQFIARAQSPAAADALVQPRGHARQRRQGHLCLFETPRPRRRAGAGIPAARPGARRAGRDFPRAAGALRRPA